MDITWAIPLIFFACVIVLWCICCCVSSAYKANEIISVNPPNQANPVNPPDISVEISEDPV